MILTRTDNKQDHILNIDLYGNSLSTYSLVYRREVTNIQASLKHVIHLDETWLKDR